jgi:hypothetical protein
MGKAGIHRKERTISILMTGMRSLQFCPNKNELDLDESTASGFSADVPSSGLSSSSSIPSISSSSSEGTKNKLKDIDFATCIKTLVFRIFSSYLIQCLCLHRVWVQVQIFSLGFDKHSIDCSNDIRSRSAGT